MKIFWLYTILLMSDGQAIKGDGWNGYDRIRTNTLYECLLEQYKRSFMPPHGLNVVGKYSWCEGKVYW